MAICMGTSDKLKKRLTEVETEISQIEGRLALAHGLGDSNSAQGITSTFSDNKYWTSRLDRLRALRDRLEAQISGEPIGGDPSVTLSVFIPQ